MSAVDVKVRFATRDDIETIAEFNRRIALETEGLELDIEKVRIGVRAHLDEPKRCGTYRVAELGGRVVGQMLITLEWSDWRNAWWWWIQSVYTLPEARGQGVFRALYEHVEAAARSDPDVCGLRLYVEKENEPAQRAYERIGMERSSYAFFSKDL